VFADHIGRGKGGGDLLCPLAGFSGVNGLQQHIELVATHAGDQIHRPHAGFEPPRHLLQ